MGAAAACKVAKGFIDVVQFLNTDYDLDYVIKSCDEDCITLVWKSGFQRLGATLKPRFVWQDPEIIQVVVKTKGKNKELIRRLKKCYEDKGDKITWIKHYINLALNQEDLDDVEGQREIVSDYVGSSFLTGPNYVDRLHVTITVP